jgi:salicylate hydroxylase
VALGIVLCGTTPDQVESRLQIYEYVRRNRASAIQILSNAGVDQGELISQDILQFMDKVPGEPPSSLAHIQTVTRPRGGRD